MKHKYTTKEQKEEYQDEHDRMMKRREHPFIKNETTQFFTTISETSKNRHEQTK